MFNLWTFELAEEVFPIQGRYDVRIKEYMLVKINMVIITPPPSFSGFSWAGRVYLWFYDDYINDFK